MVVCRQKCVRNAECAVNGQCRWQGGGWAGKVGGTVRGGGAQAHEQKEKQERETEQVA